MTETFEIAGFTISLEGDQAILRFIPGNDLSDVHSSELEQSFSTAFRDGGQLAGKRPVVALEDMPALSSRQLGALMSIQRAWGTKAKLTIRGARPNVRELFELTKMSEFFDY